MVIVCLLLLIYCRNTAIDLALVSPSAFGDYAVLTMAKLAQGCLSFCDCLRL